ncbi:hypothetical protein [Fictibacillus phosphorivorans]|uniref:hypothetical protein n=1 Tax=Fictibacillus phosphorivorans TaxID=1221500 RepID=UPI00203F2930|nr:hypothetical protein [Fictibacillus phosphorivorans]MCM3716808.1 hypothetical protein [Fictibacillus phosphorivorans]MCM3774643.1 hypothetical protein [Fictibacillus phosphorivorans]
MKWKISIFTLIIILVIGIIYQPFIKKEARESITFFPIDTSFSFKKAVTSLKFIKGTTSNYEFEWDVESESSENVYLRQDIAMIFENGKLANKMTEWKTKAKSIDLEKEIDGSTPGLWEAISYHQGEIHLNEETYRSIQKMSSDYLYTVKPDTTFTGFKNPSTATERRQKNAVVQETNKYLQETLAELLNHYQINRDSYYVISLLSLTDYNEKPLPGFNKNKSQEIIGKLWEGLYKNYFINITTKTGQKISPIGSSMPYILLSKDKTHLFVLLKTSTGENIQLIQYIS